MKTKLIALVSIICFFTNTSVLHAGTWIKKADSRASVNNSQSVITNDKTPESSNEGLYAKYWADGNDIGLSITGWLLTQNKKSPNIKEIKGTLADASIKYGYQWSERNPPIMAFSCDWTEVLYVQNKGNCDNGELFSIIGMAKARTNCGFNLSSGPGHVIDDYQVHYNISAENRENKVRRSPEVEVTGTGKEYDLISPNWDNKPDTNKSWHASGGDIVSISVGMDNGTSNNTWGRGSIGSSMNIELQNNAKNSLASIFQELSGFDLKIDGNISNMPVYAEGSIADFNLVKHILEKEAQKSNLPSKSSKEVYNFLERLNTPFNPRNLDEKLLTDSLKRYIEQFSYTFEGETEEQSCYYLAWLLAEAAARPVNTSENITNTKVSFENLIDKLTLVLNDNANHAIGDADSSEIQKELSENLTRVKGKLLYYYYELSKDPLFPAFKKPIDNNVESIILKKFENEKILFNLLNNQIKTEPTNEFYKKWMSFYFDRIAERVVFWLVVETNKDEFRNPKYWGGLHYRARSIRNGLWPVEIYLTKIE